MPGQTSAMISSLVTSSPGQFTSASRTSKARWPIVSGTPCTVSSRRAGARRKGPNKSASATASLRRSRGLRLAKAQRQPVVAAGALVVHLARKAGDQMDAEIADLGLLQRGCRRERRHLRGIELPAVVIHACRHGSVFACELDRDLDLAAPATAVHDDVDDRLLETEGDREGEVGGHALTGERLDPAREQRQVGKLVAQDQAYRLVVERRGHDL